MSEESSTMAPVERRGESKALLAGPTAGPPTKKEQAIDEVVTFMQQQSEAYCVHFSRGLLDASLEDEQQCWERMRSACCLANTLAAQMEMFGRQSAGDQGGLDPDECDALAKIAHNIASFLQEDEQENLQAATETEA